MAEEIPWEVMRDSISSFVHDSINVLNMVNTRLTRILITYKNPELTELKREFRSAIEAVSGTHKLFGERRVDKTPPPKQELANYLNQYRRLLKKRNQKIHTAARKLNQFYRRNQQQMSPEIKTLLSSVVERLAEYKQTFPAEQIGRRIEVLKVRRDLHRFLKAYLRQDFIDRDGKPVKVIFKGQKTGEMTFDDSLVKRSIYNLVTDALNHTPGRPIYVTLNKVNGHVRINVTNHGPKLKPGEIAKIGKVRFTRAWHDPKRGYGKISTRLLTEAQGGTFKAGNSKIGPMLTITLPRRTRRR
jgi:signal transduction histidine kinase